MGSEICCSSGSKKFRSLVEKIAKLQFMFKATIKLHKLTDMYMCIYTHTYEAQIYFYTQPCSCFCIVYIYGKYVCITKICASHTALTSPSSYFHIFNVRSRTQTHTEHTIQANKV